MVIMKLNGVCCLKECWFDRCISVSLMVNMIIVCIVVCSGLRFLFLLNRNSSVFMVFFVVDVEFVLLVE